MQLVPRRVILERLNNVPARPPNVIVEKWLPYQAQKRRVVYQRSASAHSRLMVPRNLIIEWEAPEIDVKSVCKDLGVINADPEEYVRKYGHELKKTHELPGCEELKSCIIHGNEKYWPSNNIARLSGIPELEGDVEALKLVENMDQYGLAEYAGRIPNIITNATSFVSNIQPSYSSNLL